MKQIQVIDVPDEGKRTVKGINRIAVDVEGEFTLMGGQPFAHILVDAQRHDDNTWSDFHFYGRQRRGLTDPWYELIDGVDIDKDLRETLVEAHNDDAVFFYLDGDDDDDEELSDDDED